MAELVTGLGATPRVADDSGDTPLHNAVIKADRVVIERLVANGADPQYKNHEGVSAEVHVAVSRVV